jgi:Family of unknown function (DUF6879)
MTHAVIHEVTDPQFAALFTSVRRSWFRLETLQHYDARSERAAFAAFRRGEPIDTTPGPWQEMVRQHVAAGRDLRRVHVVEEPLSDYIRFELEVYVPNVEAGEDVRVIPVPRGAWPNGVPRHDYWLFDDQRLWLMDYDADDAFETARLIDDPSVIDQHREWRDTALAHSIPLADYATSQVN